MRHCVGGHTSSILTSKPESQAQHQLWILAGFTFFTTTILTSRPSASVTMELPVALTSLLSLNFLLLGLSVDLEYALVVLLSFSEKLVLSHVLCSSSSYPSIQHAIIIAPQTAPDPQPPYFSDTNFLCESRSFTSARSAAKS